MTMRIIIVTRYFPPETGVPPGRLSGLADAWATPNEGTVHHLRSAIFADLALLYHKFLYVPGGRA